jgi:hypothetical protein
LLTPITKTPIGGGLFGSYPATCTLVKRILKGRISVIPVTGYRIAFNDFTVLPDKSVRLKVAIRR